MNTGKKPRSMGMTGNMSMREKVMSVALSFQVNLAALAQLIAEEKIKTSNGTIIVKPITIDSKYWLKYDIRRKSYDRPSSKVVRNNWETEMKVLEDFGVVNSINIHKEKATIENGLRYDKIEFYEITLNDKLFEEFYIEIISKVLPFSYSYLRQNDETIVPLRRYEHKCSWRFNEIENIEVTIDDERYRLPAMNEGKPYNIISYCVTSRPNKSIKADKLVEELKASGIAPTGLSNPKEAIRKSIFGEDGMLGFFVTASSKAILVKTSTTINDAQRLMIINNSEEIKS